MSSPGSQKGFSLVELMIAISIFTVLTAMSISSYMNFNNRIGTDLFVHTVAQNGHQAQVESMAVKRANNGNYPGYGLYFDTVAYPSSYLFYADTDANGKYTTGGTCGSALAECETQPRLDVGMKITRICAMMSSGASTAGCPSGYYNVGKADISFKRPSTDAILQAYDAGAWTSNVSAIRVYIASSKGYERAVEFLLAGQISIK